MNDNRVFLEKKDAFKSLLEMGMPSSLICLYLNISASTVKHYMDNLRKNDNWTSKTTPFLEAIPRMLIMLSVLTPRGQHELFPWMKIEHLSTHKLAEDLNKILETEKIITILDHASRNIIKMCLFRFTSDVPQEYKDFLMSFEEMIYSEEMRESGSSLWRRYLRKITLESTEFLTRKFKSWPGFSVIDEILIEFTDSVRGKVLPLFTIEVCKKIDEIMLPTLTEREAEIVKLYFGMGCQRMNYEQIGEKFELTRERVRQIYEKARRRIKHTSRFRLMFNPYPTKKEEASNSFIYSNGHKLLDLEISIRALNVLSYPGITYLEGLSQYSRLDVLKFRNMGRKSMDEIEELMKQFNVSFRQ